MKVAWLLWRQLKAFDFSSFYIGYVACMAYLLGYLLLKRLLRDKSMDSLLAAVKRLGLLLAVVWWGWFILDLTLLHPIGKAFSVYVMPFDPASWLIDGGARGFHERRLMNALLNCALFVPMGALLFCVSPTRRRISFALLLCVALAAGIELAQFLMKSGEVLGDEVILRSIGSCFGMALGHCLTSVEERRMP